MSKYIGNREVKKVDGWTVTFKDWNVENYPEKVVNYLLTKEPLDDTAFMNKWVMQVALEVNEVIKSHDMPIGYMNFLMQTMSGTYAKNYDQAIAKAFWKLGLTPDASEDLRLVRPSDVKVLFENS